MAYALDTKNYFDNGDAKKGSFRFSLFNTTFSSGIPTTITAGAAGLSLSVVTASALVNRVSLQLDKSGAVNTQGQGLISDAVRLNRADLAKVLRWAFQYERTAGTIDASGTSTSSFEIWIYDVQSATWQQPSGFRSINQITLPGQASGEFQTLSTATEIRLAIIYRQTDTNTWTMLFDDFTMGPNQVNRGSFVSDWISFTPTGSWVANTTYTGRYRRVGKQLECNVRLTLSGAPTSATLTINLPSGLSIDTTDIASTSYDNVLGVGGANRGGSGTTVFPYYNSSTAVVIAYDTGSGTYGAVTQAAPTTWANGDFIHVTFKVPIAGWSSAQVLSNETDTRVVAASYTRATSQSIATFAGSPTTIIWNAISSQSDSHAAMNTSNGYYRVPVSGRYSVTAELLYEAASYPVGTTYQLLISRRNSAGTLLLQYYKDGWTPTATATVEMFLNGEQTFECNAGDQLSVETIQTSGGSRNIAPGNSQFNVFRLSGPAQVSASEKVFVDVRQNTGQSIPNNTDTTVVFNIKTTDTHNCFNTSTGVFTAPRSGVLKINSSVWYVSGFTTIGLGKIYVNNVGSKLGPVYQNPGDRLNTQISCSLWVNAGDTVTVNTWQASGSSRALFNDPLSCYAEFLME